jgi:hypothetical protein
MRYYRNLLEADRVEDLEEVAREVLEEVDLEVAEREAGERPCPRRRYPERDKRVTNRRRFYGPK